VTGEDETATSPGPVGGPGSDPSLAAAAPFAGAPGEGTAGASPGAAADEAVASGTGEKPGGKSRSFWRELPVLIVVALVIALVIKTFVVQAFFIPSGSMQNTLEIGDKVLVNKLIYHFRPIHPGDIIVFDGAGSWDAPTPAATSHNPIAAAYDKTLAPLLRSIGGLFGTAPGQTDYIKRVIGVPGDHVACCNAQGLVTINGVALHEKSYLYPGNYPGESPIGEEGRFSLTVPPGRLWVLGDHRAISDDSRGHVDDPGDGTIPENKIIGRAFVIVWPPSRWRILPIPSTFEQAGITGRAAALADPALADSALTDPALTDPALSGAGQAGLTSGTQGYRVSPSTPYLPLGAGLAGAFPLVLLRRRWRQSTRSPLRLGKGRRRSG
jgi:signal peptidase I